MAKPWHILDQDPEEVAELAASHNIDPLMAKCLLNRDIQKHQNLSSFLQPCDYEAHDPFLIPDMDKAVARVNQAIARGERICIYGDYDADGVTAIAILTQALEELGAQVFYYIPDRFFEGVGLNCSRLKHLKERENFSLIITVDTGVRAFEEIDYGRAIGLDLIITDHHTPDDERPDALAVLNPKIKGSKYPFKDLSGAGVAFKLVQAIVKDKPEFQLGKYLKIAAIGTVADMVPLREENRWIVAQGLKEINREDQGPIRSLVKRLGIRGQVTALDISFKIAPRINAPGRLGDPETAINFFNNTQPKDCYRTVDIMDGMNSVRQMLERDLEAKMELQLRHSFREGLPPFILLAGRHWHRGILGIMACKILRRFGKPACILSFDDNEAHGSIRGIPGINVLEPLDKIASLLTSYGGHPEAAGVSLPVTNVPQFRARMSELLAPQIARLKNRALLRVDAEIAWGDLGRDMFTQIKQLAPFGIGNAMPTFLSRNLILESDLLRKGPWYLFEASDGSTSRRCSFYHPLDLKFEFERYDSIDLIYSLTPFKDRYQVQISEMRPSDG